MEITGYLTHKAKFGETPDILALKYYNEEFMASYILEANTDYNNVVRYEGGEELVIPIFDTIEDDSTQPPWKRSQGVSGGENVSSEVERQNIFNNF